MSDLFQSYETEFSRYLEHIQEIIKAVPTQSRGISQEMEILIEKKEGAIDEGHRQLTEAENCLRNMEIDLACLDPTIKYQLQPTVRKYRRDFDDAKKEFFKLKEKYIYAKNQETVMGVNIDNMGEGNRENREHLLRKEQRIVDQNMRLQQANSTALQTYDLAVNIQDDLERNTRTIQHSHDNVREMNKKLGTSNKLITRMTRREMLQKLFLYGLGFIFLVAIVLILYFKVFK